MASNTKQLEEKRIQFLRRMVALPHNRNCFDCGQRGPTYVNMTIGSYVCTACSGILRGINPPHRVKSISMGTFTQEEIDLLTEKGNEYNRHVWLALHDSKEPLQVDSKDESKLKEHMTLKYERKRWHAAPSPALSETAKSMNNSQPAPSTPSSTMVKRPVSVLPPPPSTPHSTVTKSPAGPTLSNTSSNSVQSSAVTMAPPSAVQQPNVSSTSTDLLNDVFSSSSHTAKDDFNQPNFANFSTMGPSAPAPSAVTQSQQLHSKPLFPSGAGQVVTTAPTNASQWSDLAANPADKYASLSGLFSDTMSEPPQQAPPQQPNSVNWNPIGWNSPSSTPAFPSGQVGMSWGGTATPPVNQTPSTAVIGGQAHPGLSGSSGWAPGNVPSSGVNPFLVGTTPPNQNTAYSVGGPRPSVSQTTPAAFGGHFSQPTQNPAGFSYSPAQVSQSNPFGSNSTASGMNSFPTQPVANGANMAPFGGVAAGFPLQNGMTTGGLIGQPQQANQWVAAPQWGTPVQAAKPPASSVNPFLTQFQANNTASPFASQPAVTNPFM